MRGRDVTAVLGPTNTGKTHLAIERMLAHPSGLIGLPLRLLAREVYGKLVERAGVDNVALVTGEEKIKPASPRYWVSTVEAMPRDLNVSFLALDEIQLASDLDRGHVFTDRLLSARGRDETLLLGADTMRGLVQRLLPGVSVVSRPRLSQLTYAGSKKLTRLPKRSAIVAFSAEEVYAIAELMRRQRGGAAVVLGALSPRTRNAQVELYQSGEVDFLVATDAIGMGLNLDVGHVAFAGDRKFDGFQYRRLNPGEFAQIAGRAGRHLRDGTFGTTGRCPPMEEELAQKLEAHAFEPVRMLQWRNADLDFSSLNALIDSLSVIPTEPGLTRAPGGDDLTALEHAARDADTRDLAYGRAAVELLWSVCQVPDYRRIAPAQHADLIASLYGFLRKRGKIPADWFARQVASTDHAEGGIDTLSNRIAHIRTWTFVANRLDWLDEPEHWQGVTRGVEDKLSDALHARLTQRFVDRRTSVLMRRLKEKDMLEAEILPDGEVRVGGHLLGRLAGFQFTPDPGADAEERKALRAAASQLLAGQMESRARRLAASPDNEIVLASDGFIRWQGEIVARLAAGEKLLEPHIRILADEQLTGTAREIVEQRLQAWVKAHVAKLLGPLQAMETATDLEGMGRGIAFQIVESLGVLDRTRVAADVRGLDQTARAVLRKYGVRFGAYHLYLPALMKPAPRALAAQLWALRHARPDQKGAEEIVHLAASGRTSVPVDKEVARDLYRSLGFKVAGERAVRIDILERLADLIRPAAAFKPGISPGEAPAGAAEGEGFTVTVGMTSLVGCSGEDFASVLRGLGYRMERRPAPPPAAVVANPEAFAETPVAEAVAEAVEDATAEPADAFTTEAADAPAAEAADAPEAEVTEVVEGASDEVTAGETPADEVQDEPVLEAAPEPVEAVEEAAPVEAAEAAPEASETPEPVVAEASADAPAGDPPASETPADAEPAMIEIWRMGRYEPRPAEDQNRNRRGPRRGGGQHHAGGHSGGQGRDRSAEAPAGGTDRPTEGRKPAWGKGNQGGGRRDEHGGGQRHRSDDRRGDRQDRQDEGRQRFGGGGGRPDGGKRYEGNRHGGGPRHEGPRADAGRNDFDRPARRPERAPDPDSPFAKLLALKSALEAQKKDRT